MWVLRYADGTALFRIACLRLYDQCYTVSNPPDEQTFGLDAMWNHISGRSWSKVLTGQSALCAPDLRSPFKPARCYRSRHFLLRLHDKHVDFIHVSQFSAGSTMCDKAYLPSTRCRTLAGQCGSACMIRPTVYVDGGYDYANQQRRPSSK